MSPNLLLERNIKVSKPNEVVVGDITYLPLLTGGWVYLATWEDLMAESFFSRYKAELLEGGGFADIEEARAETFSYIEGYYNRVRRHSGLGYKSPEEFERKYYEKLAETLITNQQKG